MVEIKYIFYTDLLPTQYNMNCALVSNYAQQTVEESHKILLLLLYEPYTQIRIGLHFS